MDTLVDDAELGIKTTTEDEALLKLVLLEELAATLALDVLFELVMAALEELVLAIELVLLDELITTTDELLATGGSSLGALVGIAGVVVPAVSVPAPPHALNNKAAVNTSERDFMFIAKSISPLFICSNLPENIPFYLYWEVNC